MNSPVTVDIRGNGLKLDYRVIAQGSDNLSYEDTILDYLSKNDYVTRKDVELMLGKPKFAVLPILNSLLDSGKIAKEGSARAVKYRLS